MCPVLQVSYAASLWCYREASRISLRVCSVCPSVLGTVSSPSKASLSLQPWGSAASSSPSQKEAAALSPEQASSSAAETRSWAERLTK